MIVIGLTGSIGMGKSTVASMFADLGIPVFDADTAVRALYEPGGAAVTAIAARFPGIVHAGAVDRDALARIVFDDRKALADLEAIVHPLVRVAETRFRANPEPNNARYVVVEIPLLFETGAEDRVDVVVVVSAPGDIQRGRVLARPGMTEAKFEAIVARQLTDEEKRTRADFVINTGQSLARTRSEVAAVIAALDHHRGHKGRGEKRQE